MMLDFDKFQSGKSGRQVKKYFKPNKITPTSKLFKQIINLHKFCKESYTYRLGESKKNGRPLRKENIKNRCDIIFVQWVPGI